MKVRIEAEGKPDLVMQCNKSVAIGIGKEGNDDTVECYIDGEFALEDVAELLHALSEMFGEYMFCTALQILSEMLDDKEEGEK